MDHCDRCGYGAALRATHPEHGVILLCGHHGMANREALEAQGFTVVVLEAGGDSRLAAPYHYDVPAFHPFAAEDPAMSWDFFVRHYRNDEQQKRDPKFVAGQDGIWYPRAGTLGGCTAHNAMIIVRPNNTDWDAVGRFAHECAGLLSTAPA